MKHSQGTESVYFDVKQQQKWPKMQKRTPNFEDLADFESRRKWYWLTQAIRSKDIERAATEKYNVEEEQREKLREREKKGIIYKPKYFKKGPEDFWMFMGHESPEYQRCFGKWEIDGARQQGPQIATADKVGLDAAIQEQVEQFRKLEEQQKQEQ